ncbi:MAG: MauE/DoxX family redox-associated membrane protein [Trichloromonadaceae bacterium]
MKRLETLIYHAARLLLGGLFLYAGLIKGSDVTAFAGNVANYQLLPYSWNYLVAATLPAVEAIAGLLLVVNCRVRPAAVVLGALNLVFMVALVSVILRGLDIDCGCFNPDPVNKTSPQLALLRDVGIMLLVVLSYWLRGRRPA